MVFLPSSFLQGSGKSLVDERFSSLFEREEFEVDETAEEYRLRNPTLSAGKKGHNSDSEDDLKGVYQAVEDDEDVVEDDDNDDDENFDDVNYDEGSELYDKIWTQSAMTRVRGRKASWAAHPKPTKKKKWGRSSASPGRYSRRKKTRGSTAPA